MRILSVDGGGYLGLASAAFLQEVERHFGKRCADTFDLFCGTSTGAIIALALATGLSAEEVVKYYRELGNRVFPARGSLNRFCRSWVRGSFRARYSINSLKSALESVFGDATLADVASRGKAALVAAYNVSAGAPRIFKTDRPPRLTDHNSYRLADIALASSAAPLFFPLVDLAHPRSGIVERYCDGGVCANSPALLGFVEAVRELGQDPQQIDVLSLSSPRSSLAERSATKEVPLNRGVLGWAYRLGPIMLDGTSAIYDAALSRLIMTLRTDGRGYCRVQLSAVEGLGLDRVTASTTHSLLQIGTEEARKGDRRRELQYFFAEGGLANG